MPRDLPGMYWDESKNRYFPISARPSAGPSQHRTSATSSSSQREGEATTPAEPPKFVWDTTCRRTGLQSGSIWCSLESLKASGRFCDRNRITHEILTRSIGSSCRSSGFLVDTATSNTLSSFAVSKQPNVPFTALIGDSQGWLYTYHTDSPSISTRELYLGADVSSVCLTDQLRIAVPFGPSCEIAIQSPAATDIWSILRIMDKSCHDIRTAHLLDSTLVLGAAGRGILLPDIDRTTKFRFLPTGSDVLSVHQLPRLVYTGCRNGSIKCFDKRLDTHTKGQSLLEGKYQQTNSSITHLDVIHEWQLLVSTVGGDLATYDLRFARSAKPLMQYQNHVNDFRLRLGLAVSPCQSLLFAAGSDRRIRAWSTLTGRPIISTSMGSTVVVPDQTQPPPILLQEQFPHDISAMQVTESTASDGDLVENSGLCLWVASGPMMYRYWLGQQPFR